MREIRCGTKMESGLQSHLGQKSTSYVAKCGTNGKPVGNFLLANNSNFLLILHHFEGFGSATPKVPRIIGPVVADFRG